MGLNEFVLAEQRRLGQASGLSELLQALTSGVQTIGSLVSSVGLHGQAGYTKSTNVQGEAQTEIDIESDRVLVELLSATGQCGLLVSEERENVIETGAADAAPYVVAFDPLDGSSNISSNIPVGTIFSIWRKKEPTRRAQLSDFLQPARALVGAGYAVYGSKTTLVLSFGNGATEFTFDPKSKDFVRTKERLETPRSGAIYSINEGNSRGWGSGLTQYIDSLKDRVPPYSARYAGSLVADFDRNLNKGGIYLYPPDKKNVRGKLRLLYECAPLAFICHQAGGKASDGKSDILDILPQGIHDRCPLYIGSAVEVDRLQSYL